MILIKNKDYIEKKKKKKEQVDIYVNITQI